MYIWIHNREIYIQQQQQQQNNNKLSTFNSNDDIHNKQIKHKLLIIMKRNIEHVINQRVINSLVKLNELHVTHSWL